MRIASAAVLYFAIVFGVGLLSGPVRVFCLEPRIAPAAAVICEAPFLPVTMVIASRWVPRAVRMRDTRPDGIRSTCPSANRRLRLRHRLAQLDAR